MGELKTVIKKVNINNDPSYQKNVQVELIVDSIVEMPEVKIKSKEFISTQYFEYYNFIIVAKDGSFLNVCLDKDLFQTRVKLLMAKEGDKVQALVAVDDYNCILRSFIIEDKKITDIRTSMESLFR